MLKRLILIEVIILAVQAILYFGCEVLQHDHRDVFRPIDERIPLVPGFAYVYLMWFPLIALFPLLLYYISAQGYTVYQLSIIVSNIVSTAIYVLFPTRMERHVPEGSLSRKLLRLIYFCDFKGSNCSPSLHCTHCYIIMTAACLCGAVSYGGRAFVLILCAAIIASTVLIKQHALRDVLTAIPLAAFSYAAGWCITACFGAEAILRAAGLI